MHSEKTEKTYGNPRTSHKTGYYKRIGQGKRRRGINTNHVKNPVLVERGVYQNGRIEDIRPEITSGITLDALPRQRKQPFGWVLKVFLEISRILALLVLLVEVVQKCLAVAGGLKNHSELPEVEPT